ncbi:hypothetical protein ACFLTT_02070 [Chloroflexota bacterium]
MKNTMEKTWKPTVIGILNIISGVFGLITVVMLTIGVSVIQWIPDIPGFVPGILWIIIIPLVIVSILATISGVYALQRRKWGWVLAGSIASVFASTPILRMLPIGLASIILTALSKNEFD